MVISFKVIYRTSYKKNKQSTKKSKAVFYRRKYPSNSGNIAHAHIILALDWKKIRERKVFLLKKIEGDSEFDVIRSDEIGYFIANNIISS